jgi:hypothetical protein
MSFTYKMTAVSDLLEQIGELPKVEDRVAALRANGNPTLKSILGHMFDPRIKFALPEGTPPYRPSKFDEPAALIQQVSKFYLFVEGIGPRDMKPLRREHLFIQLLESVSPNDALLLIAMKEKRCPFPNITYDLVKQAFPELFA